MTKLKFEDGDAWKNKTETGIGSIKVEINEEGVGVQKMTFLTFKVEDDDDARIFNSAIEGLLEERNLAFGYGDEIEKKYEKNINRNFRGRHQWVALGLEREAAENLIREAKSLAIKDGKKIFTDA
jgi:hypothetical protein